MSFTQEQATAFIAESIKLDSKMPLTTFLTSFCDRFYPNANFDFMNQFLEWSKFENANQFMIPHEKLFEYGITIDTQSQSTKKRIIALELEEGVDFSLRKFSERGNRATGGVIKNQYLFTPKAFKLMLMSATKHKNHTVDVSIYRKYYLFLEEAIAYYKEFQFEVADRKSRFNEQKFKFADSCLSNMEKKLDESLAMTRQALDKLDTANRKLDVSNAKLNVLNNLGVKQYHLSRDMVRNIDHHQLTSNKLMNLTSDALDQLDRMTTYVHDIHDQFENTYNNPKFVEAPQIQGRIWMLRTNADQSVDIIFKVGQKKYLDRVVAQIAEHDSSWSEMFGFKAFGSGVSYRLTTKRAILDHFRELITTLNGKRTKALETYPGLLSQYDGAKTNVERFALQCKEKKAEVELLEHEIRLLEQDATTKFTRLSNMYKAPVKFMRAHNKAEEDRYDESLKSLLIEIEHHNSNNEVRRSFDEEKAQVIPANIINTKEEWFALNELVEGTPPKKADFRSPLIKELKSSLRALEKEIKALESSADNYRNIAREMECAKMTPERMRKVLNRIKRTGTPHTISEMMSMVKIKIGESTSVEIQGEDSESIDSDSSPGDIKMMGYKLYRNSYTTLDKFKELVVKFEENMQPAPSIDGEIVNTELIQDRVAFLSGEKNEMDEQCATLIDEVIDIHDIASKEIEFDGNSEVSI